MSGLRVCRHGWQYCDVCDRREYRYESDGRYRLAWLMWVLAFGFMIGLGVMDWSYSGALARIGESLNGVAR